MWITYLGTGNACNLSARGNACTRVQGEKGAVAVDFGPTALHAMLRFGEDPAALEGVLLTHFHGDHTGGLPTLVLYLRDVTRRREPFPIYGHEGVEERVTELFRVCYGAPLPPFVAFQELTPNLPLLLHGTSLTCTPIELHHKPESLGYLIEDQGHKVGLTGDTGPCKALTELATSCDLLITECTLPSQDLMETHLGPETIAALAAQNPNLSLRLIHTDDQVMQSTAPLLSTPKIKFPKEGTSESPNQN